MLRTQHLHMDYYTKWPMTKEGVHTRVMHFMLPKCVSGSCRSASGLVLQRSLAVQRDRTSDLSYMLLSGLKCRCTLGENYLRKTIFRTDYVHTQLAGRCCGEVASELRERGHGLSLTRANLTIRWHIHMAVHGAKETPDRLDAAKRP